MSSADDVVAEHRLIYAWRLMYVSLLCMYSYVVCFPAVSVYVGMLRAEATCACSPAAEPGVLPGSDVARRSAGECVWRQSPLQPLLPGGRLDTHPALLHQTHTER